MRDISSKEVEEAAKIIAEDPLEAMEKCLEELNKKLDSAILGKEGIKSETRIRMSIKATAKGEIQMDITSEATTLDEAATTLELAICRMRKLCKDQGLKLAGEKGE